MAIRDWYPLLNWERLPNFGFCHTIRDTQDFKKNFVETTRLAEFRANILETLDGSFESPNFRVLGKPGAGKTTFLYSLLRMNGNEKSKDLLGKYFVYIFHVNRARSADVELHVMEEILSGWDEYYNAVGLSHIFESICTQRIDLKSKLVKCSNYYLKHRDEFTRVFVFALDDVDLLETKMMHEIVIATISHLEAVSVKKWLFIREETFEKYDATARATIAKFFPEQRPFPRLSLFDVINHRIKNTAGEKALNPFTPALCEKVQAAHDDCLRESLPALKSILEDSYQAGFHQNQSIEFVQNYLDKAGISVLIRTNRLTNLHTQTYRVVPYPIPLDIISLMAHIQDQNLIFAATNHAINARKQRLGTSHRGEEIKLSSAQFSHSLNALVQAGLAERNASGIFLTPTGRSISSYCGKKFYTEACLKALEDQGLILDRDYSQEYQLMSFIELDHSDIAKTWTTHLS